MHHEYHNRSGDEEEHQHRNHGWNLGLFREFVAWVDWYWRHVQDLHIHQLVQYYQDQQWNHGQEEQDQRCEKECDRRLNLLQSGKTMNWKERDEELK